MRCKGYLLLWVLCATALFPPLPAAAATFPLEVTDLAGREVTFDRPPQRIFLDNPRHLFALAALLDDPVARLSGWRDTLDGFDHEAQARFDAAFPALASLPTPGSASAPLDPEALVALDPDLVLFDLARRGELEQSSLTALLAALDIPVLYIDFREHPLRDTPPSLRLLGRVLDAEPRAARLVAAIAQRRQRVEHCAARAPERPRVLIDIAPGLKVACCRSNFDSGLADLVKAAGGDNIAAGLSPGRENLLNPEYILSHPPDVIVATAAQWPRGGSIRAGFGVDSAVTLADMAAVVARRPGWADLEAVQQGRFHALWHGHHQGPFAIVALEALAGWLHPRQCGALDPERTLTTLYRQFMPIAADGTFEATLPAVEAPP